MPAGPLNHRIRFERETRTEDEGGGYSETWTTVATVWAGVEPISAREQLQAGQLEESAMYRVTIRRRSDLTAAMRVVWLTNGGKVLNLRQVPDPGPREAYMVLVAESGVVT